jgi:hypothetical protein
VDSVRYHWLLGYSENRMDTQPKRIIDLSKYNNVGIILKLGSGVFYANKAAGLACHASIPESRVSSIRCP